jgi:trbC/VIRB2 family
MCSIFFLHGFTIEGEVWAGAHRGYFREEIIMKKLNEITARVRNIKIKDVRRAAKASLPTLAMMGLYMLPSAIGFASEIKTGIDPLDKPLNVITTALTGPIPLLVIAGSIGMGGMSWAMGWEQQIMMRCVKGAGGGAIALGVGKFMENMFGNGVNGIMF